MMAGDWPIKGVGCNLDRSRRLIGELPFVIRLLSNRHPIARDQLWNLKYFELFPFPLFSQLSNLNATKFHLKPLNVKLSDS